MTATPTLDAILAAILREPGDDLHRLAFADALDEQAGERGLPTPCPRAEFIRVQVEIAAQRRGEATASEANDRRQDWLERRERAILRAVHPSLHFNGVAWCWKPWTNTPGQWSRVNEDSTVTTAGMTFRLTRGFVSAVTCTLDAWLACGPALTRSQPVERATVTDLAPWDTGDGGRCAWWNARGPQTHNRASVPAEVYALAAGMLTRFGGVRQYGGLVYPTRADALDALSDALLTWARRTDPAIP